MNHQLNIENEIVLVPSVKTSIGRHRDPLNQDATQRYADMRLSVVKRDRFTCQGCGLQVSPQKKAQDMSLKATGYLEVHHKDNNHQNNQMKNLITLCPFCHQVFHLGFAGSQQKIQLIYLNSISQADLNILCVSLGIAMFRGHDIGEHATSLYDLLESQKWELQNYYGSEFNDPQKIASALIKIYRHRPSAYKKRELFFKSIRVLPNLNKFIPQITYWSDNIFLPVKQWQENWKQLFDQWSDPSA